MGESMPYTSPHFAFPAFTNSIMGLPRMSLWAIWSFLLLSSIHLPCFFVSAAHFSNETDLLPLLNFKHLITDDPLHSLSSWNHTLHFCHWQGVTCGGPRHPQRVTALNLTGQKLVGPISPYIANLTFLRIINFTGNSFYGAVPEEIGRLFRLRYLRLTNNTFTGEIPANLTHCFKLQVLRLTGNQLAGRIPTELGSLSKLTYLSLGRNSLAGSIPPSLGNLSSLWYLRLTENSLEGSIPDDLCQLVSLKILSIGLNKLSEYAMGGKASTQGDVYSYGILLLEMITGKGPTDDVFKDNLSLHHFAKMALVERLMEIVDPQLLLEEAEAIQGNENQINSRNRMHDCLISMVKIGVLCSAESPRKRMQMRDVVFEMHTIKDLYLGVKFHRDKQVRS
ncbi:LRR receptor-like serine/threonine-protein kinase EFR [Magnolia sinica]|uniref:LRR receptor-like serine/threonine-protein kinase EFR n=1 Tax=Magnolia sinica TaxID=86752 RepID=UPI0026581BE4|nr:LRR receptor-like serine/threonine-protein kinase EFR [Magnolia sinica]